MVTTQFPVKGRVEDDSWHTDRDRRLPSVRPRPKKRPVSLKVVSFAGKACGRIPNSN